MEPKLERDLAVQTYRVLVSQLDERGVIIDTLPPEQLETINLHDLSLLNKRYQSLLRNPIPRG